MIALLGTLSMHQIPERNSDAVLTERNDSLTKNVNKNRTVQKSSS